MTVARRSIIWAATIMPLLSAGNASGQFSPRVEHYRFLPLRSVINQQGGFGGFDVNYRVSGEFDFRIQPSMLTVFPPVHSAVFENVKVVGRNPTWGELDVDQALNLSGLRGWESLQLPRGMFRFQGTTGDGSAVDLQAMIDGPWFYLRGNTNPPPNGADFFEYRIRALARRAPTADFNGDEQVDGADLAEWSAKTDANGGDFLQWQRQVGETPPSLESFDAAIDAALAAASAGSTAAVPEPAAITLGLLGIGLALTRSSSRHRRQ